MLIRAASENDIQALAELATTTYVDAFGHTYTPAELEKRIQETRSESYFKEALKKDTILVAEDDGILIGYVEFGDPTIALENIKTGDQELGRLYVRASHQRKGIGKALLEKALAHPALKAAKNVYLDVWQYNEGAIRLYKEYGFSETGKENDGDIIMVRRQ